VLDHVIRFSNKKRKETEMNSGWVHNLNPVIMNLGGIQLYYYGLAYAIGFVGIHWWLRFRRKSLGWDIRDVYDFSILFSVCILLLGRLFSVVVYHREYYQEHLHEIFYVWQGGMATHGVLLGAVFSIYIFSRWKNVSFWQLADAIVIPAAFLLALGRIGNFVNGQISGTVTTVWWAVKFPDMAGFRHPVTLYEALKNLTIIPILWGVSRHYKTGRGVVAAHFVFWYGFLRLFTDIFRDHGAQFMGIGVNQYFNTIMAAAGLILIIYFSKYDLIKRFRSSLLGAEKKQRGQPVRRRLSIPMWTCRSFFILIILFSMVIRSAWNPQVLKQRRAIHEMNRIEKNYVHVNDDNGSGSRSPTDDGETVFGQMAAEGAF